MVDGACGASIPHVLLTAGKGPRTDPENATTQRHNTVEKTASEMPNKAELAFLNHVRIQLFFLNNKPGQTRRTRKC